MKADPSGNIPIYSFSLAGLILSPLHNQLLCSYAWDVGSTSRKCQPLGESRQCVPGCSRYVGDTNSWCANDNDNWQWQRPACPFRNSDLRAMMNARETVRQRELKPPGKVWEDHKVSYSPHESRDQTSSDLS